MTEGGALAPSLASASSHICILCSAYASYCLCWLKFSLDTLGLERADRQVGSVVGNAGAAAGDGVDLSCHAGHCGNLRLRGDIILLRS